MYELAALGVNPAPCRSYRYHERETAFPWAGDTTVGIGSPGRVRRWSTSVLVSLRRLSFVFSGNPYRYNGHKRRFIAPFFPLAWRSRRIDATVSRLDGVAEKEYNILLSEIAETREKIDIENQKPAETHTHSPRVLVGFFIFVFHFF
jgi:hypothetical protein